MHENLASYLRVLLVLLNLSLHFGTLIIEILLLLVFLDKLGQQQLFDTTHPGLQLLHLLVLLLQVLPELEALSLLRHQSLLQMLHLELQIRLGCTKALCLSPHFFSALILANDVLSLSLLAHTLDL